MLFLYRRGSMADFGLFKRGRRRNAVGKGKSGQMTAFLVFALQLI